MRIFLYTQTYSNIDPIQFQLLLNTLKPKVFIEFYKWKTLSFTVYLQILNTLLMLTIFKGNPTNVYPEKHVIFMNSNTYVLLTHKNTVDRFSVTNVCLYSLFLLKA